AAVRGLIAKNRAGMPVLKSLTSDAAFETSNQPPANMQAFIKGAGFGIYPPAYPTRCGNFYSDMVQSALSDAVRAVVQAGGKVEDAFKAADAKIQACLDGSK